MASSKLTIAEVKAATGISSGVGQMSQAQRAAAVAAATPPAPTKAAEAAKIASAVAKADVIISVPSAPPAVIKDAGKTAAAEVKTAVNTLQNTQQLEVKALKQEGAGSSVVSAEKTANKAEITSLLQGMLANNFNVPSASLLTQASSYDATSGVGQTAYNRVTEAFNLAQQYNLAPGKVSGDVTTGIPLHRVDTYLQSDGEKGGLVKKVIDFRGLLAEASAAGVLTPQDIVDAAKTAGVTKPEEKLLKQLETKGFIKFGDTSGSNVNYATTSFTLDPETGSYVPTGTDKYRYDAPSESGLGTLGSLIGAGLAWWNPLGWSAMASGALGGAVGGGLSTGTLEGALKGGLLGGLGGGAMDYLNSTGMFQPSGWDFGPGNLTADQLAALQATGGVNTAGWTPEAWDLFSGTGMPSSGGIATQAPAPVTDAALSYIQPGQVVNLNGTNYLGLGAAGTLPIGTGTAETASALTKAIGAAGGIANVMSSGGTGVPAIDNAISAITGGAAGAGTDWAKIFGAGTGLLGSYLQGDAASDAAKAQAEAQLKIAEMMRFRPVGVSTRFGQSQFGYDSKGNLVSAGYNLAPDVKAQQDQLMASAPGFLSQFTGSQAATAPIGAVAQQAMALGQGYLSTTPQQQAAKYMADQQALLAPYRERDWASTLAGEQARGTYGLSVGGTSTGLMAANPRLEALANAQRMQDLNLAAQATQGGMDYAKFGTGMVGAGGDLLKQMYGTQTAAYQPYQTALGGAQSLEQLGQGAMDIGTALGAQKSTANQTSANLMSNAAATTANANAYSPWGALLSGASNALTQYQQQQQPQSAFMYNPYTGQRL